MEIAIKNRDIGRAMAMLRRLCAGNLRAYKASLTFEPPCDKRKRKAREARRRAAKLLARRR